MANKDYYETLGVAKGASDADLKSAYRKLAMQYHPDRNPGDKTAEAKFKDINEAYDVLKDPQKRAAYDKFGHAAFQQGGSGGNPFGSGNPFGGGAGFDFNGNMEDLFEDILGGVFGSGAGTRQQTRRSGVARGADLRYNLDISLQEAYTGTKKDITFTTHIACDVCHGTGAKAGTKPQACGTCNGSGTVHMRQGFFSMSRTCPDCNGNGSVIKEKCPECKGHGRIRENKSLTVTIPPGVDSGTRLRLQSEGDAGIGGGPTGDLFVFINVAADDLYERDGTDLALEVPISLTEAVLGTTLTIPAPDGKPLEVKVPEGTQSGSVLRLRGKGMPNLTSPRNNGDILLHIQVDTPTKLSKKQRDLIEQLAATDIPASTHKTAFTKKLKQRLK